MYRSSPFRSTLNTGYITALDKCKVWTTFGHFCPYFHKPYTLLCLKDDFPFTFPRGLIWKFDNPSTTLSLAPGKFDNPYKGAESAGCQKLLWLLVCFGHVFCEKDEMKHDLQIPRAQKMVADFHEDISHFNVKKDVMPSWPGNHFIQPVFNAPGKQVAVNFHQLETPKNSHSCLKMIRSHVFQAATFSVVKMPAFSVASCIVNRQLLRMKSWIVSHMVHEFHNRRQTINKSKQIQLNQCKSVVISHSSKLTFHTPASICMCNIYCIYVYIYIHI